ncbi:MAG: hypothetical protein JSV48_14630, partial [Bradyrhizobium sp.]
MSEWINKAGAAFLEIFPDLKGTIPSTIRPEDDVIYSDESESEEYSDEEEGESDIKQKEKRV